MKQKIAVWVSQRRSIPYRLRKTFVKKTCPKILSDYEFEINFYGMKYAGNTKDGTDRLFFMFGACEKYMLRFMRDYYMEAKKDDFIFLDVGAHVGNHALFMSKYATKIHAFEPNPKVRESLNAKIYQNQIENIVVHPVGLGNRNERMPFYVSKTDNLSLGSFRSDHDVRNDAVEELEVRIGDEVMAKRKIERVDMIKIDVEGFEREVIEGLHKTIEKSRPLLIVEISSTTRKSFGSRDDFESIFPKDYSFFQFSGVTPERERYKLAAFDYAENGEHLEFVAVPKEKRIYLGNKITDKLKRNKTIGGDN